ncbi:MAG: VTT domain-containing protein [Alphaproteobacteria bacterium]|nr:VTT domain-containing protein [Alphaproteobacteria bacterium]
MRRWLPLLLLAAGLVTALALGAGEWLSFERLAVERQRLNGLVAAQPLAVWLGFVGLYAVATAVSLPGGAVLSITGGFLFGVWLGTLGIVIGATLGATVLFLAARSAMGQVLRAKARGVGAQVLAELSRHPLQYLLVLRLVPAMPFWLVNLLPALVGMRVDTYVMGTALGIIPGSAVLAWIGVGLDEVLARGDTPDVSVLLSAPVLLPILALAALSIVPVVMRRWKRPAAEIQP